MAINTSSLTSRSVSENTDSTVEFLMQRPPGPTQVLETALPPGKLYAYYDATTAILSLFVIDPAGLRFLPV